MSINAYFYHDKPVFGLDIGFSSIKVMQINGATHKSERQVNGYGHADFDPAAVKDGVITDPKVIATVAHELLSKHLVGEINTRRVAVSIPASRTFNRTMTLPPMKKQDLGEAVRLEAEQYIPVAVNDLYMDYDVIREDKKGIELLVVASPRKIIDSYLTLTELLGLEAVAMETTISAASRLFVHAEQSDVPTVLLDVGALASDITIYENATVVTSTVGAGGDNFSTLIAKGLGVTKLQAHFIKTTYGLGLSKQQKEIMEYLNPVLGQLVKEIRRMIRYYEERASAQNKIRQVVTMGGGANMPGLSEYLTNTLRLPVRMCNPWQHFDFNGLDRPSGSEKSRYVTVAGLALREPKEIFK